MALGQDLCTSAELLGPIQYQSFWYGEGYGGNLPALSHVAPLISDPKGLTQLCPPSNLLLPASNLMGLETVVAMTEEAGEVNPLVPSPTTHHHWFRCQWDHKWWSSCTGGDREAKPLGSGLVGSVWEGAWELLLMGSLHQKLPLRSRSRKLALLMKEEVFCK